MTLSPHTPFVRDRLTWFAYLMLACIAYAPATLSPSMPFLRQELNLSYTMGGFLLSVLALGMILAGATGDRLAHRWGRRFVLWSGSAGLTAGAVCLALSRSLLPTAISVWLMGFCGSLAMGMIQAILSDRHGEQRAVALTEANVAAGLTASLAPPLIGGFQRAGVGWRGALFLIVAAFALIVARFRQDPVPDALPAAGAGSGARSALPFAFWVYWIVICLVVSIEWCLGIWGANFLETVAGLSKVSAATMMGVYFLAILIGRLAGSGLSRVTPSATLLLIALGVTLLGFPIFWLARLPPLNVIGLFITGLGVGNLFPLTLSLAVGLAPGQANVASARVSLAVGVAILLAPLVLGWIADRLSLPYAYGIVVVLVVAAIVIIFINGRSAAGRGAISLP
jgi:MFS family permease